MDRILEELLDKARHHVVSDEDREDRQIAMAVANGFLSDSRVTVEAMKAVRTVDIAAHKNKG